jgi:PAS domain S-box-containing protein
MPNIMHLEDSPSESTAHILLVDDQPAQVSVLRAMLEPLGHKLTEAASGEEALLRLTETDYAVILLDEHGLDGFETAKLIRGREKARHTPIIFLITYETDRLVIEEAYALGGVDFIVKPLVPVLLKAKVATFIELRQVDRGEFERRLSEESFRNAAIVETALDCIVTIDHQGKIVEFNPAAEATFGFSRAEAVGQQMAELIIPPSLRDRHYRGLAHYLATGEGPVLGKRVEMPALRADGTEFPVELAITRIPSNGAPAFTAYIRDISERKRAERRRNVRLAVTQLLAHESTMHEAATSILQVVCEGLRWDVGAFWVVDRNARVLCCHATWHTPGVQVAWFENLSRQRTFAPGVRLPGRVWECGKPVWIPDIKGDATFARGAVALQEGLHGAFGFPILLGKEVLGVVEFFSHEVREPDDDLLEMVGTIGGQIGLFMEQKRAEEQLRRQNEELSAATRQKDAFLAMLAHELRNPLAPIRNGLQIMRSPAADQKMIEQIRSMMERQIGHLTRIVDDLVDVSRITRSKIVLRKERLDLSRLVRVVTEDERSAFESAGLDLEVEVPELPIWIIGDATRLTQVLENLFQNAVKFTDRGGKVSVRVWLDAERQRAVIAVRDTGIGIELDALPRLFETFVQPHRSVARSRGGLGLGLALVKRLVELHGGDVRGSSLGAGRGAEFTVQLPVETKPAALPEMPAAPGDTGKHLRILVVEDDRDCAESLRMLLELCGYEVTVAYSGTEGVRAAEERKPDVVLCDLALPGLDGYGVASRLRRNPATAKARMIAVTGYGSENDRRRTEEAGFERHMVKPVDPHELQQVLATLK